MLSRTARRPAAPYATADATVRLPRLIRGLRCRRADVLTLPQRGDAQRQQERGEADVLTLPQRGFRMIQRSTAEPLWVARTEHSERFE